MKPSAMLSWKSLVAKIHQPPPLSSRDSQKLLLLLGSSFQRHLDSIHPSILRRPKTATEIHLNTILAAPHFNNVREGYAASTPPLEQNSQLKSLRHIQMIAKSPMTHFAECVSLGTATREIATACLEYEFLKALNSPDLNMSDKLKLAGAGTTVLNWLHSSSHGESLAFLRKPRLRKWLILFLIAEGKESLIWEWLQGLKAYRVIRFRSKEGQMAIWKIQSDIIYRKFTFEIRYGPGLSSAIETLSLRAREIRFLCGPYILDGLLALLVRNLRREFSSLASNGDSIDLLIQMIDKWQTDPLYRRSEVELYRSEGPDIASALALLREYPTKTLSTDNDRRRRDLIFLSFKLTEMLLRDGSDTAVTSATWIMGFLQDHFAKEIVDNRKEKSVERKSHERPRSDEAFHLRLLDALPGV